VKTIFSALACENFSLFSNCGGWYGFERFFFEVLIEIESVAVFAISLSIVPV